MFGLTSGPRLYPTVIVENLRRLKGQGRVMQDPYSTFGLQDRKSRFRLLAVPDIFRDL